VPCQGLIAPDWDATKAFARIVVARPVADR
jgi:hypothetical protein